MANELPITHPREIHAWSARNYPVLPDAGEVVGLVEEVGELATATFEESADRVRKEAVQVAVMAMRMILDGDHCYEPWRAEKGLDPLDPALRALKGDA